VPSISNHLKLPVAAESSGAVLPRATCRWAHRQTQCAVLGRPGGEQRQTRAINRSCKYTANVHYLASTSYAACKYHGVGKYIVCMLIAVGINVSERARNQSKRHSIVVRLQLSVAPPARPAGPPAAGDSSAASEVTAPSGSNLTWPGQLGLLTWMLLTRAGNLAYIAPCKHLQSSLDGPTQSSLGRPR